MVIDLSFFSSETDYPLAPHFAAAAFFSCCYPIESGVGAALDYCFDPDAALDHDAHLLLFGDRDRHAALPCSFAMGSWI